MIRIGLFGYGNISKGILSVAGGFADVEISCIFTRRDGLFLEPPPKVPVYGVSDVLLYKNDVDVLIMCGGSAKDLPVQTPFAAEYFNLVDSFDTHADIASHFSRTDEAAKKGGRVSVVSVGWDPGLFSLFRLFGNAVMPGAHTYTFWGRGLSQGHSDALRRVNGVSDARQYTVPDEKFLNAVCSGECPETDAKRLHRRECFVVPEENADTAEILRDIVTMKNYFDGYRTDVSFVSEDELQRKYSSPAHSGNVIVNGVTGENNLQSARLSLSLASNAEFTACVLLAYARAAYRLFKLGEYGCRTVFDIAPKYLLPETDNMFEMI